MTLNGTFGLAFGGEDLVTAWDTEGQEATLKAGNGIVFSIGTMVTPLWGGPVGFGIGFEGGWKYTAISASNGSLSLLRFPLVGSFHTLIEVDPRWYLLAAAGVHHEVGVRVSGDGVFEGLDTDLDSSVGFMGEFGIFFAEGHIGWDLTLRYSGVEYRAAGASAPSADASSLGVFASVHYVI